MTDPCVARTAAEVGAHIGTAFGVLRHIDIAAARTMIDDTVAFASIVDPDRLAASEAVVAHNRALLDAVEAFRAAVEPLVFTDGAPT